MWCINYQRRNRKYYYTLSVPCNSNELHQPQKFSAKCVVCCSGQASNVTTVLSTSVMCHKTPLFTSPFLRLQRRRHLHHFWSWTSRGGWQRVEIFLLPINVLRGALEMRCTLIVQSLDLNSYIVLAYSENGGLSSAISHQMWRLFVLSQTLTWPRTGKRLSWWKTTQQPRGWCNKAPTLMCFLYTRLLWLPHTTPHRSLRKKLTARWKG